MPFRWCVCVCVCVFGLSIRMQPVWVINPPALGRPRGRDAGVRAVRTAAGGAGPASRQHEAQFGHDGKDGGGGVHGPRARPPSVSPGWRDGSQ